MNILAAPHVFPVYKQVESDMRSMILIASMMFTACGCDNTSGSDDNTDPDAPMMDGDAPDAPPDGPTSYAPCDTCCDPVNQTGCAVGQACYERLTGPASDPPTFCDTAGSAGFNEHCFVNTDCAKGNECINGTCTKFCVTNADCAPPFPKCFPFAVPPGRPTYGICSPQS